MVFKKAQETFWEEHIQPASLSNSILEIYIMCTETYTASSGRSWYFFLLSISSRGNSHVVDLLQLTAYCCLWQVRQPWLKTLKHPLSLPPSSAKYSALLLIFTQPYPPFTGKLFTSFSAGWVLPFPIWPYVQWSTYGLSYFIPSFFSAFHCIRTL